MYDDDLYLIIKFDLTKMNIELLEKFKNYHFNKTPISLSEIMSLELSYNDSQPFPKALRELLFLAGKNCEILEYGLHQSQKAMQEYVRNFMMEDGVLISQPFFVIDVYTFPDEFLFVYLDNSHQDPFVFAADIYSAIIGKTFIRPLLHRTLSQFLDARVSRLEMGENPF